MKEQEDKAKFFAQYWGQQVFQSKSFEDDSPCHFYKLSGTDENDYLLLTPLSDITDEDAKRIATILQLSNNNTSMKDALPFTKQLIKHWLEYDDSFDENVYHLDYLEGCDYLRSKGYALPYLNYSIEDLIEKGWIKLKEK